MFWMRGKEVGMPEIPHVFLLVDHEIIATHLFFLGGKQSLAFVEVSTHVWGIQHT